MFSETTLKYLKSTIKTVHFWRSARLDYDSKAGLFTVPKSVWNEVLVGFNVAAHFGYNFFLLGSYFYHMYWQDLDQSVMIFFELVVLGHAPSTVAFHIPMYRREERMASFINQSLIYFKKLKGSARKLQQLVATLNIYCCQESSFETYFPMS